MSVIYATILPTSQFCEKILIPLLGVCVLLLTLRIGKQIKRGPDGHTLIREKSANHIGENWRIKHQPFMFHYKFTITDHIVSIKHLRLYNAEYILLFTRLYL